MPTLLDLHSFRSAIKVKYDPSRRAISHPCGESVGEGKCAWESDLRKQAGEGSVFFPKSEIPRVGEEEMDGSQSGGRRSRGRLKQPVVRFGTSVNDLPKSIDLNGWKTNRSFVQME
ncbi:hypothetical protein AVEN_208648-1 [Araneus ventricosus]|uniref:Uncharacterized protein n=1 Tax=Araneus ventricosus TaxID=182803 RepID=A0A4Y2DSE0_ARAVE|nr:hypothetical protein AVEN_208648-1 [Araneus ventricosus]